MKKIKILMGRQFRIEIVLYGEMINLKEEINL